MAHVKTKPGMKFAQLYDAIEMYVWGHANSAVSRTENLNYFYKWWAYLLDVTIGENVIDVHQLAGTSIEKNALAMYNLAQLTGKVITTSHNGVKIIMVDQNG